MRVKPDPDSSKSGQWGENLESELYLPDIWYLMIERIAPQTCCRYPTMMQQAVSAAIREISKRDGDLDLAVRYLRDIVEQAPCDWFVFQQAGQLLNIIEWRRSFHRFWFQANTRGNRLKSGTCGPYVAQALAYLESGADDDALNLTGKILEKGDAKSDDPRIAHMIRAALFICGGEIERGEEEFCLVSRSQGKG